MTYDYGPLYETSLRLLETYGREIIIEKPDSSQFHAMAVFNSNDKNNPLLTEQDRLSVIIEYHNNNIIQMHDFLVDEQTVYKFIDIKLVKPGNTALLYECIIGK